MASKARTIREQLPHPIVDGDGHWVESIAVLLDYLRDVGGARMAEDYASVCRSRRKWYEVTDEQRKQQRLRRVAWWLSPSHTRDRATIMMPSLLHSRLDELGIDFALMYPSIGLNLHRIPGDDLRQAVVRAFNIMARDCFQGHEDRFAAVGVISAITPREAIDELHFIKRNLGLKAVMMVGAFPRPIPAYLPEAGQQPYYIEALGLDNEYDYDPLWQAYMDTGIAVTAHGGSRDWVDRMSWSNDVFNHISHFANANHAFAKALFLGGVVKRFPKLNFAFLEGGMGWATSLCCDLQGHWEKRNWQAMQDNLRPSNIDAAELARLIGQYGGPRMKDKAGEIIRHFEWDKYDANPQHLTDRELDAGHYDDFRHLGPLGSKREIREVFARNFYFGCEADDPTTMFAFDPRMKARLKAVFSSDIGHWDVHHIDEVVPEVYEALQEGHLTAEDFRDFTFGNAVRLHGGMNPDFFKGTVIEKEARAELAKFAAPSARAA